MLALVNLEFLHSSARYGCSFSIEPQEFPGKLGTYLSPCTSASEARLIESCTSDSVEYAYASSLCTARHSSLLGQP
jgi:hypothetical protein